AAGGKSAAPAKPAGTGGRASVMTPQASPVGTTQAPPVGTGPVPATPATRRLARELGVDLRAATGTGPGGRVTDDDVKAAAGGTSWPRAVAADRRGPERAAVDARIPERAAVAKPLAAVGLEPPALPRFEPWGPLERPPRSH